MRKEVFDKVHLLCDLFPGLTAPVKFSEVLNEQEITVFKNFSKSGLSAIKLFHVQYVEKLLTATLCRDTGLSARFRNSVCDLRNNKSDLQTLQIAYEKIIAHKLTGTYPLPSLNFSEKFLLTKSQKFYHQLHNVIHYVLEQNDIYFADEQLDESLVVFLHSKIANTMFHYKNNRSKNSEYTDHFEELYNHFDKNRFVQMLKEISAEQLRNLLRPLNL